MRSCRRRSERNGEVERRRRETTGWKHLEGKPLALLPMDTFGIGNYPSAVARRATSGRKRRKELGVTSCRCTSANDRSPVRVTARSMITLAVPLYQYIFQTRAEAINAILYLIIDIDILI